MEITHPRRFLLFCLLCLLLLLGIGVVGSLGLARIKQSGQIAIESGESAQAIGAKMVEAGFIKSTLAWRLAIQWQGAHSQLQVGTYQLEQGEGLRRVAARMSQGEVVADELTITYPEGFTLEQMAERTAGRGIETKEAFIAASRPDSYQEQYPYLAEMQGNRTVEGYLFPDTYRVKKEDTASDVIKRLLATFNAKLTDELRAEAKATGRTIDQVVIMASIIEREVRSDEDMALVSGILWKRFDNEEGLYADATIRYALKKWDGALTVQDLSIDSPYNTRRYRGLPPSPISNPGLRALIAAIRPQQSDFYYYLSTPDGHTIFAKTNNEHNVNKAKYLR